MSENIFAGLNPPQKEAVEHLSGPLLVLAGAGSGKTRVLTNRIANLIAHEVPAHQILAVTFTNKAAREMEARIEKLLTEIPTPAFQKQGKPSVGTFHALCVRILREDIEALGMGINQNFVIFDTADTQSLMKLIMKENHIDEKETKIRAVLTHISGAKNQLVTPETYLRDTEENRFTKAVKILYPLYQKRLRAHNALDFDDLLQKAVELYEKQPEVLEKYRNRWNHLLIDEYQDTNFAQYRFVRLLTNAHQNLCVVGDDHQSIYSFRGADFRNILDFEKDFTNAKVVKLEQNYRSTGNILKNANQLIKHNRTGREKNLWTEQAPGDPIEVVEVYDEKEEGRFIAEQIRKLKDTQDIDYSNMAVLYRMNAQSRALEESFMKNQIPYQIIGGTRFFDRLEIKDIIAYLRLIFNPRDDIAFMRIINVPGRKIGKATIDILRRYTENYSMSLFEILSTIDEITELPQSKKIVFKNFKSTLEALQEVAKKEPISILLDRLIEKIGYLKHLDDGTSEGESRIQNVKELFSVAMKYDSAEHPLAAFLEGIALIADLDNHDASTKTVTLMTIHASKGLEFPVVFLPGWEEGIFPGNNALQSSSDMEEERRLAYVAITRAEKKCYISHARQRMLFGQTNYSAPSSFVGELHDQCIITKPFSGSTQRETAHSRNQNATVMRDPQFVPQNRTQALFGVAGNETEFSVSNRIRHKEFGEGTIILISGDVLTVAFAGKGVKKIVASVAPIEII